MKAIYEYLTEIGSGLSRTLNATTGDLSRWTLSARAYRDDIRWLVFTIDLLFIWQSWKMDHCRRWYEHECEASGKAYADYLERRAGASTGRAGPNRA